MNNVIKVKIDILKLKLQESDYKAIKYAEGHSFRRRICTH